MNNKLIFAVVIIILVVNLFVIFPAVVNADSLNLFSFKKQKMTVTLKNDANIDTSRDKISQIPRIRIIKTTYRDKEWSKMVNKMDLPKMENPFKNEFIVHINKNADINEIYSKIKEMDFVENVEIVSDEKCAGKQNK